MGAFEWWGGGVLGSVCDSWLKWGGGQQGSIGERKEEGGE